jgi:hypothetical protein
MSQTKCYIFSLVFLKTQKDNISDKILSHKAFQRSCYSEETNMKQAASRAQLAACFMPVSCMAYASTLKMGATCSSETLVDFHWTTQCYIPEDMTLHNHCCENLKSYF